METKKKRIIHSPEFKTEVLKLSEKVGVAKLKRQLVVQAEEIDIVKKQPPTSQKI